MMMMMMHRIFICDVDIQKRCRPLPCEVFPDDDDSSVCRLKPTLSKPTQTPTISSMWLRGFTSQ